MEGLLLMLDGIAMILVVIWSRQAVSRRAGEPLKGLFRYPECNGSAVTRSSRRLHTRADRAAGS